MGRISRSTRSELVGVDYRLAPEHPYPAAVEDALASYRHLITDGVDPRHLLIGGDSAGGGLALVCMQALRDDGYALPSGAFLFSPWTDLTNSGESFHTREDEDPSVNRAITQILADLYRNGADASLPGISPLFGDLTGLPPLLVQVGDFEVLRDDSTRLAERSRQAGVDVDLQVFDGSFHVFQGVAALPEAAKALEAVGAFADRVLR